MRKPTPNQYEAAHRDGNIIVSAGAGSGKTFTMIERIVNKLLGGVKLEQMLIVTFTRAAAADMRFKLSRRLAELKKTGRHGTAISDALDAMSVCNIGTLHSYCQRLIKSYFYVARLDPSATLAEDGEAQLMRTAAAQSAVHAAVESGTNKEFAALYDMLSSRKDDGNAVYTVLDIIDYALSTPDPRGYLTGTKEDAEFFDRIDAAFSARRETLVAGLDALKPRLDAAGMIQASAIEPLKRRLYDGVTDASSPSHGKTGGIEDELNAKFLKLKRECAKLIDARADAEEAKSRDGAPYARAICAVAADALDRYNASKARQGKIDYSDLEHGALAILRDDRCMEEISRTIKYVFIDEFQDVNPLQSEIARTFAAAGAEMFVVGDVKQSIYGFRRCSPAHFINAVKGAVPIDALRSGAATEADCVGKYVHIPLTDNFRSDASVVDFINGVFDGVMTESFGGVDYAGGERLVCGKPRTPGKVTGAEFALFEKQRADGSSAVYSVKNSAAASVKPDPEAVFIADTVEEWLDGSLAAYAEARASYDADMIAYERKKADFAAGVTDIEPEKPVPPEPPTLGEAAVLTRSADAAFYASLAAEFDKRGIPYDFGRKSSVKTYPAAVALVDILRCIDNMYDDVALYTALRSPMGGFSDEELAEISKEGERMLSERGRERSTFCQRAESYGGEYSERLAAFFALRDDIVKASKKLDCADTLGYITSKTDYFLHVYESGGDARAVQALIDYAAERRTDVHGFLSFYDSADFDLEIDGGGDAVTVTTQHSSKGLEYDLVIVANVGHLFNMKDATGRVLVTDDGVAVKLPVKAGEEPAITVPWVVENGLIPNAQRQEELRLLYVALTRAKNKLVVCGKTDDLAEFAEGGLPPVGARCQLDFLRGVTPSKRCEKQERTFVPEPPEQPNANIVAAVKSACETAMPHSERPIKTCVTALAHSAYLDGDADYTSGAAVLTDDDRGEKRKNTSGTDGRLRGTAYHRAMELADLASPDLEALEKQCENFSLVDGAQILRAAAVMRQLTAGAKHVYKERYFIADMPTGSAGEEQTTLVQGVIDCMAVFEDGSAVIVDYKTGDPATLLNDGYKTQLALYARAVEIATQGKLDVRAAYIYSFESGELLPVDIK